MIPLILGTRIYNNFIYTNLIDGNDKNTFANFLIKDEFREMIIHYLCPKGVPSEVIDQEGYLKGLLENVYKVLFRKDSKEIIWIGKLCFRDGITKYL